MAASANLLAIRAAIVQAKALAAEFQTGTIRFYEDGNTTPVLVTTCRVKKPKPSAFDAGNASVWSVKRDIVIKVPLEGTEAIRKGLIAQVDTDDGDPMINLINFTVQSTLGSQFSAERSVVCVTEGSRTPRIH
jgi:hypothetical protein